MLPQHTNAQLRFLQQEKNAAAYVIPFIEEGSPLKPGMRVLEIGCGEGGVLLPFLERGCYCVGVDLTSSRIALAGQFLGDYLHSGQLRLINKDIYLVDFSHEFEKSFDLIILKDAIEHIPEQERLMNYLKPLLKPGGFIYLGFPPWYMPHGGHQQICQNRILSMFPYVHLFPARIYGSILRRFKEDQDTVQALLEIKQTGISIERFESILKRQHYVIICKRPYLLNPIYRFKFGWKPRVQSRFIARIPFLRNFVTTCIYYLVKQQDVALG